MAAGNQQKHLFAFCCKSVNSSLGNINIRDKHDSNTDTKTRAVQRAKSHKTSYFFNLSDSFKVAI